DQRERGEQEQQPDLRGHQVFAADVRKADARRGVTGADAGGHVARAESQRVHSPALPAIAASGMRMVDALRAAMFSRAASGSTSSSSIGRPVSGEISRGNGGA